MNAEGLVTVTKRNPRLVVLGLSSVGACLLVGILVTIWLLLHPPTETKYKEQEGSGLPLNSKSSNIAGVTTSFRNLAGLTLHINQIDTCQKDSVSAYLAVTSDNGTVHNNFAKQDVKVFVDGKATDVFDFTPVDTTKVPLSNMLAVDKSGSMAGASIENARAAVSSYVDHLKTNDQVGLIAFSSAVDPLVDMSSNRAAVKSALANLSPTGDTALYEATWSAIEKTAGCGRKAVTVLTDGEDTVSKNQTAASVVAAANNAALPVFAVGIKSPDFTPDTLKFIADSTGGQFFEANTPEEIAGLYDRIDQQLTGQFVAKVYPGFAKNGGSHKLRIVSTVEGTTTESERTFTY